MLDPNKYSHLKTLAFLAHLVESETIVADSHTDIEFLAVEFDKTFVSLYGVSFISIQGLIRTFSFLQGSTRRVCCSLTASLSWMCSRLWPYVQLLDICLWINNRFVFSRSVSFHLVFYYLTASFSRTIHGSSTVLVELIRNIDLLRQASLLISCPTCPWSGKLYVTRINSSARQALATRLGETSKIRLRSKLLKPSSNVLSLFRNDANLNISFYNTLFVDGIRFNAYDMTMFHRSSDACVLYESTKDIYSIGFVECPAHAHDSNEICLVLMKVEISSTADTLDSNRRIFRCNNVLRGSILLSSPVSIRPSQIVQKLAFRLSSGNNASTSNTYVFFQYPNVKESTWCTSLFNKIDDLIIRTTIQFNASYSSNENSCNVDNRISHSEYSAVFIEHICSFQSVTSSSVE